MSGDLTIFPTSKHPNDNVWSLMFHSCYFLFITTSRVLDLVCIYLTPLPWIGHDTRSIFFTGLRLVRIWVLLFLINNSPANMAAFLNLLGKSKPARLTSFIGEHLMQQVGWSILLRWTCPTHRWCLLTHIFIQ